MIKYLKRRYHYRMAIIYSKLYMLVSKNFYYHADKHKEIVEMEGES